MEKRLTDENARLVGGMALTSSLLAAGHYFRWWIPLDLIGAYTYGVASILAGQGVYLKFNRQWRRLCAFAAVGGSIVTGAYLYDVSANRRAKRLARGNGERAAG